MQPKQTDISAEIKNLARRLFRFDTFFTLWSSDGRGGDWPPDVGKPYLWSSTRGSGAQYDREWSSNGNWAKGERGRRHYIEMMVYIRPGRQTIFALVFLRKISRTPKEANLYLHLHLTTTTTATATTAACVRLSPCPCWAWFSQLQSKPYVHMHT